MTTPQPTTRRATAHLIMSFWPPRCDANRNAFPVLHAVRIYSERHPSFIGVFGAEVMSMEGEDFADASFKLQELMRNTPAYRWMLPYVSGAFLPREDDAIRAAQQMFGIKFNTDATDDVARAADEWFSRREAMELDRSIAVQIEVLELEGRLANAVKHRRTAMERDA